MALTLLKLCCVNGCGGHATHYFDLAEYELRNGKMVEWRPAGRKLFCGFCVPKDAKELQPQRGLTRG